MVRVLRQRQRHEDTHPTNIIHGPNCWQITQLVPHLIQVVPDAFLVLVGHLVLLDPGMGGLPPVLVIQWAQGDLADLAVLSELQEVGHLLSGGHPRLGAHASQPDRVPDTPEFSDERRQIIV